MPRSGARRPKGKCRPIGGWRRMISSRLSPTMLPRQAGKIQGLGERPECLFSMKVEGDRPLRQRFLLWRTPRRPTTRMYLCVPAWTGSPAFLCRPLAGGLPCEGRKHSAASRECGLSAVRCLDGAGATPSCIRLAYIYLGIIRQLWKRATLGALLLSVTNFM